MEAALKPSKYNPFFLKITVNMSLKVFVGLALILVVNNAEFHETLDEEEIINSQMLSSCVCKLNGDIYNLTTLGKAGKSPQPRVLSFFNTRDVYQYFFNLCYPFSWPPSPKTHQKGTARGIVYNLTPRHAIYKKIDEFESVSEIEAYPCENASLCQFNAALNLPYFKAVTMQSIENGMLHCSYNKTIERVQWTYKGVGRIFKTGGMVLTLICDENQDIPDFQTQYDVDRNKGNPWKYISVRHKCCCPNKCSDHGGGHSKHTGKKEKITVEVGVAGGGFLVLLLFMFIGYRVQRYCYSKQPPFPPTPRPYPKKDYGTFMPKAIPYEEIDNLRQIGEGAFGIVSRARWRNSDVAVKRIKEHVIDEDIEPFIRESIWMSKLPHHNIVQFYGVCVLKPNLCIITEYMEGGSVADIIHKKGRILSSDTRIKWAIDAAKGMTYLHSQTPPIIHRDLKSDNLLVDENGLVKIGDFGAFKLLEPIFARHHTVETKKERQGTSPQHANCDTLWAGTLRWSAPEVIPRKEHENIGKKRIVKYTTACDIYSFGITVWEMVSNKRPYYDILWDSEIMEAIHNGRRPDIPEDCHRSIKDFINKCWHGNPDVRPTFEEILEELNNVKISLESGNRTGGTWPPLNSQTLRHAAIQAL